MLATPGLTALRDEAEARAMLVVDALRAVEIVRGAEGPIVDVGAGGGSPGIPLAHALPERELTLLEASRISKKPTSTNTIAAGTSGHHAWRSSFTRNFSSISIRFTVRIASLITALAQPSVAAELCLPLVRPGGIAVLWLGPSADLSIVGRVSALLGGDVPEERGGLVVLRKLAPTPPGFPRRAGMPKKRPLG